VPSNLRALPVETGNPFVFVGNQHLRGLSTTALRQALARVGRDNITVHGFRSAFRDWCGDQTAFAREVIEAALAHTIENRAEAAYRRSDALEKRRRLMATWATFCSMPTPQGSVTSLRRP
jgi:integrase